MQSHTWDGTADALGNSMEFQWHIVCAQLCGFEAERDRLLCPSYCHG